MSTSAIMEARAELARQSYPAVMLTSNQQEQWDETRTAMLWHSPFFAHIFYAKCEVVFSDQVPIASTDGRSLIFNPATFFKFTVKERVFIAVHEIAHVIWMHCELRYHWKKQGYVTTGTGKRIPYDANASEIMNQAADYVINAMLTEAKIGQRPACGLYDTNLSRDGTEAVVDVWATLMAQQKQGGGKGKQGQTGFDKHLDPGAASGQTPHQAAQERKDDAQSWANTITQAAAASRAIGKLPASLDRLLGEVIEPAIDWREHIQGFFNRRIGNTGYSWQRPDRRLLARTEAIIAPGCSGNGCGDIVVGIDTSGSIGQQELTMFFGCLGGILEDLRPRRLIVMWCDANVGRVDELEDASELHDLRRRKAPGGGGTDFRPVFDEVAKMGIAPDALVYLTDTFGSFPRHAPAYPVLWAKLVDRKCPWGDEVMIPPDFAKGGA